MRVVRWLAWTALLIVGPVAIPPALGMDAELSDRIRWSGLVLQISGLFTVVVGLDESRQLFGKPTFIAAARSSVVRLGLWVRSLFIKPKPVTYIITPMNIENRTEVSVGRVTVHGGPLDQRVANLEADVEAIWERRQKPKPDIPDRTSTRLNSSHESASRLP